MEIQNRIAAESKLFKALILLIKMLLINILKVE
jgi:hypothetical protein